MQVSQHPSSDSMMGHGSNKDHTLACIAQVLTYGTSIMHHAGGLFNNNYSCTLVKIPPPSMLIGNEDGYGFITTFMNYVNATWPHPQHALINSGTCF